MVNLVLMQRIASISILYSFSPSSITKLELYPVFDKARSILILVVQNFITSFLLTLGINNKDYTRVNNTFYFINTVIRVFISLNM